MGVVCGGNRIGWLSLLALTLFLPTRCSFDRAHLDDLRCVSHLDCPDGVCNNGYCDRSGPRPAYDGGRADADIGEADAIADTAAPDLPDGVEEPDLCLDPNACGGCEPLAGTPGEPCEVATCGIWSCDGPDRVLCQPHDVNACGGCAELGGRPGDSCGECGRVLVCDGPDAVICRGPEPNPCGGCGGPMGEIDAACLCSEEVFEEHRWTCVGNMLACLDGNDDGEGFTILPETTDAMPSTELVVGGFVSGDTADWYSIHVDDEFNLGDGLYPDLTLTGLSLDLDLCAYWAFDGLVSLELACESGELDQLSSGEQGCCSTQEGTTDEVIRIRNSDLFVDRLDTIFGEDNDDGTLYIVVRGESPEEEGVCSTYELSYRF